MKNKGFTLAEVLITLGIIGVVAAITLPSLLTDTTSAQIGPKLGKAVSVFEQANMALLNKNSVDSITDAFPTLSNTNVAEYINDLTDYLKATVPDETYSADYETPQEGFPIVANLGRLMSKDGTLYLISPLSNVSANSSVTNPYKRLIGAVYVDINGYVKPNEAGTDLFGFALYNDGSLRPIGGKDWITDGNSWQDECPEDEIPSNGLFCTGHVFENNMKVLYR